MEYIRIKNWSKHQHYKTRCPPWIKLHNSLFEDYEFSRLSDKSKWHLVAIWLLASRSTSFHPEDGDPILPLDIPYLTKHTGMEAKIDLNPLLNEGFLLRYQDASSLQAVCSTEKRREETEEIALAPFSPSKMVELWNGAIDFYSQNGTKTKIPKVRGITKDRQRACIERIKDCTLDDPKWRAVLNAMHGDDWMSGRKPSPKYPDWKATFDYVIRKSATVMRLIEGYQPA